MRPAPGQRVPDRRRGALDSIVRTILALPPAIENAQHKRAGAACHRSEPRLVEPGFYTFAAAASIQPLPAVSHITAGVERREADRSPFRRRGNGGGDQT